MIDTLKQEPVIIIDILEQESCDDCVSRANLISKLEILERRYGSDFYWETRKIVDKLPSVTLQPKWILCSERLPNHDEYIKNNGLFNVTDGNRSYSEWFDIYETKMFGEPTINGFRVDCVVTAWMPLPEPYRGEINGNIFGR